MTLDGKQFTVILEILTAVARDQKWPDVVPGISARFIMYALIVSDSQTCLQCLCVKHLFTFPLILFAFC